MVAVSESDPAAAFERIVDRVLDANLWTVDDADIEAVRAALRPQE